MSAPAARHEAAESAPALARRSRRGLDPTLLLIAPAALCVLGLFVYPFVYGLALSFQPYGDNEANGPLGSYLAFFGDPRERLSIWNTLRLAVPATFIDVAVALPLAYRLRRPVPGQRALGALFVIPMTLGTVLIAEGMLQFFGPAGWVNKSLLAVGLVHEPVRFLHNYLGTLISLLISDFPAVFLLLLGYAAGIDPALDKAARVLGASWWQRTRRVTLPMMAPGIAVAAALSFVATFSVFPSAVLVGNPAGETRVIAFAAWQAAYERFDYSEGSAIAIVMGVIELGLVAAALSLRAGGYRRMRTEGAR
ncbi:MAG: sugar ABC transporter permease [Chloroflexi bacterium]|nr:MAG: sugar ABC transporter permease [Chloroflexota bacterium]TMG36366.1 MAG: sugar ABC transporter permease [Chloroflexota bacterium]